MIHSFLHILISHSIWVWVQTHFLLVWIQEEVEIELDVDFKCALEEGEKLKVKGTSQVVREGLVGLS